VHVAAFIEPAKDPFTKLQMALAIRATRVHVVLVFGR